MPTFSPTLAGLVNAMAGPICTEPEHPDERKNTQWESEQSFFRTLFLSASPAEQACKTLGAPFRHLIEITFRRQQIQHTLLDWLRVEYQLEKPDNKVFAETEIDSDTWVSEVKRIRGQKQPLTAAPAGLRFLLSAFPISAFHPARPRPRHRNIETGAHAQRPR